MLAHRFPPSGGAGVQRNLQLARHFGEAGVEAVIVTGPGSGEDYRWLPPDEQLAGGFAAAVHRVSGPEPSEDSDWERRSARWLRTPLRWERWWRGELLRLGPQVGADAELVHASVAPYSSGGAAVALARRLRRPLVVDLEDPWALDEMLVYPTGVHRRLELRQMGSILRAADAVVMNTPEARKRVIEAFPALDPGRVHAVTNAFDPADFARPAPVREDGRFRIVHTGSLHTDLGQRQRRTRVVRRLLGGEVEGVDFLTRSHVFLLDAVASLLARRPELDGTIEVVLAGVFTAEDRAVAARHPFATLRDFVPHAETLDLMRTADLLYLPMQDLPAGHRAGLVPHKTYEYLASGRPILAAVPDGDARDLLAASGAARLCRPSDTAAIAAHVEAAVARQVAGEAEPRPDPEVVERCSCHRLVRELAAVYDTVAAGARSS